MLKFIELFIFKFTLQLQPIIYWLSLLKATFFQMFKSTVHHKKTKHHMHYVNIIIIYIINVIKNHEILKLTFAFSPPYICNAVKYPCVFVAWICSSSNIFFLTRLFFTKILNFWVFNINHVSSKKSNSRWVKLISNEYFSLK